MTRRFGKRVSCAALAFTWAMAAGQAVACGPPRLSPAIVARVTAEGDILLQDGRALRLAGLQMTASSGDRALKPGDAIAFGAISDEIDRWGRLPALVFARGESGGLTLLHETAIANGARVRPEPGLGDCLGLLSRIEARAAPAVRGEAGRFDRIEAQVQRVGEGRGALFVWLPDRGAIRTMGVVRKRHLARFATAGVDVKALGGKTVRLRGVRGVRNAAAIAIASPEQIEIVK